MPALRHSNTYRVDEAVRFRPEIGMQEPIEVDPGFDAMGNLRASAGCDYNLNHTQQHWGWFTPEQVRRGDMPCTTCGGK